MPSSRSRYVKLIVAFCIAVAPTVMADRASGEPFFAPDKALHFGVGAGLAAGCGATLWALEPSPDSRRLFHAIACTALVAPPAILKEVYDDGRTSGAFSGADIAWSMLGAAVGSLIIWGVRRLFFSPRARRPNKAASDFRPPLGRRLPSPRSTAFR